MTLAAAAALVLSATVSVLVAVRALDPARGAWFVASLAAVAVAIVATGSAVYHRTGRSGRVVVISPLGVAAVTWLLLFVLRPLELYIAPGHAELSVGQLGFGPGDLARTVAVAGVGCAAWCAGYLAAIGHGTNSATPAPPERPFEISRWGAAVALVFGTFLWVILFMRQGGPSALIESPVSIRRGQTASFYAFFGVWLVQGATLYALVAVLRNPSRIAKSVLAAGAVLSVCATVALQLRSLAALTCLAAVAIYFIHRPLSRRRLVFASVALVVAVGVLLVTQQIRAYTHHFSVADSVEMTARTPVTAMWSSDLSTYDNFVAIQQLVPESIPYLRGETLMDIPAAMVPRALWPEKPLGIDFMVSSYLYPGVDVAVPISAQGELYWNGSIPLVAAGMLLLGLALGAVGRFGLAGRSSAGAFVLYAVMFAFTHHLLTRGLAVMIQNLVLAIAGVAVAVALMATKRQVFSSPLSWPWARRTSAGMTLE